MSTWKQKFNKKFGFEKDAGHSRAELSRITGISPSILTEVYKRGIGAWQTNIESVRVAKTGKKDPSAPRSVKMGKEQWAMARIYSFIMGGKTQKTADADLWARVLKQREKKKN
jgi:hypothetical protein